MFLQGFCGDVDPFANRIRWGSGTEEDIDFYGRHLASRLAKVKRHARRLEDPVMRFSEARVDLPLAVAGERYIHEQRELFQSLMGGGEKCRRFVDEWAEALEAELNRVTGDPMLRGVPLQAVRIGEAVLVGCPAEVFCEVGLRLKEKAGTVFPVGFANGSIGYVPTEAAFDSPDDYACHIAPMFYGVFSYTPEVADMLMNEMDGLVQALDSSN